jgi:hypothetical protein
MHFRRSDHNLKLAVSHAAKKQSDMSGHAAVLAKLSTAIAVQPRKRAKQLELVRLSALKQFRRNSDLLSELVNFDAESKWQQDRSYLEFRARVYAEVEGKLFDAIRTLRMIKRYRKEESTFRLLIRYLCIAGQSQEAQTLLDECTLSIPPDTTEELQRDIYEKTGSYDKVLAGIRRERDQETFPFSSARFAQTSPRRGGGEDSQSNFGTSSFHSLRKPHN